VKHEQIPSRIRYYMIAHAVCGISGTEIHVAVFKEPDLVFGFFTCNAVGLPDSPREPFTMSRNRVELAIGQSFPLPKQIPSHLRPVAFYEAPLHSMLLVIRDYQNLRPDLMGLRHPKTPAFGQIRSRPSCWIRVWFQGDIAMDATGDRCRLAH
jgi:hypothetical protein